MSGNSNINRITNSGAGIIFCGFWPKPYTQFTFPRALLSRYDNGSTTSATNCLPEKSTSIVPESVKSPEKYYRQNEMKTR